MPVNPAQPPSSDPDARQAEQIQELFRRVQALEAKTFGPTVVQGTRTDLTGGVGPRIRLGLDAGGTTMVVERWSEAGTKTTATFS